MRILDVTKYLGADKVLYIRIADSGASADFDNRMAFLRRLTVYGTFDSDNVFVRLANTSISGDATVIESAAFRSWK